ncbi:NUDIX hydrolase [Sorangium sp. So ce726]|uniref:NUDIX domain-containing protein n=1 Tax=Sorangium sp. So ce726 TaxID=3133319 RepID=UPI003F5FD4DE
MAAPRYSRRAIATVCALTIQLGFSTSAAFADGLKACYVLAYDCDSEVGADVLLARKNIIMKRNGGTTLSRPTALLNAGQYVIPGGLADPEEGDAPKCAIREFKEQTGIDVRAYRGVLSRSTITVYSQETGDLYAVQYVRVEEVTALASAIQANLDAATTQDDELHEVVVSPAAIAGHYFRPAPPRDRGALGYVMPDWMREQYDEAKRSAWNGEGLDEYLSSPSGWFKLAIKQLPSCS